MTKRILSAILLAGMISSSAFASNARQAVMFTGDAGLVLNKGSMYYDDMYNIFYNPAYVNDFKNWVIFEKGSANVAEGGFVSSMGNFNVGVYLNRQAVSGSQAVLANTFATTAKMHPIDVVIGGDAGVKWGLGVTYAGYKSSSDSLSTTSVAQTATGASKGSAIIARAGVSIMEFEPFVEFKIKDKAEAYNSAPSPTSLKIEEANKGMTAGLRYHFGEWTPYAIYDTANRETTASASTTAANNGKQESSTKTMLIGAGRNSKLGDSARLMYAVAAAKVTNETKNFAGLKVDGARRFVMPLNLAVEADALSWLTLRAGMQYNVFNHLSNSVPSGTNTTVNNVLARAGGTFHINKVDAEFAFGNDTGALDSANVGFDSSTFSTVSLSYKW